MTKGKNQEIKNTQERIKKLRINAKENELGEFIIGRNKPLQEIENQINRLSGKLNELEERMEEPEVEKGEFLRY